MNGARIWGQRTAEEREAMARELGYHDARTLVRETIRILNRNTYDAMQEARKLLERVEELADAAE